MIQKEIASSVGEHKSTIRREVKRTRDKSSCKYITDLAKAAYRKKEKRHSKIFTSEIQQRVVKLLKRGFSPEQITDRSKLECKVMVFYETI